MKKIVLLGAVVAALVGATPSPAAPNDVNGPPCADITGGSGGYTSDGTVSVLMTLGAPACNAFTYTLYVITAEGTQTLSPVLVNGNQLGYRTTVNPDTNSSVCIYAVTSVGNGNHVFDRAPDADGDCTTIPKSGSPGFGGFS